MANSTNFRELQSANKGKTYFLLASMGLLTWLVAYAALTYFGAGTTSFIVPIAVGIALVGVWGSYYGSDKLVITMTGAKVITREDAPELFNLIEEVVIGHIARIQLGGSRQRGIPGQRASGRERLATALTRLSTRLVDCSEQLLAFRLPVSQTRRQKLPRQYDAPLTVRAADANIDKLRVEQHLTETLLQRRHGRLGIARPGQADRLHAGHRIARTGQLRLQPTETVQRQHQT